MKSYPTSKVFRAEPRHHNDVFQPILWLQVIKMHYRFWCVVLISLLVSPTIYADTPRLTIGYVNPDLNRVNMVDGRIDKEKPGWFVELSNRAGLTCDAEIAYVNLPWKRILQRVENGKLSAALNSSYKAERAVYGSYPMADGMPDVSRAHSHYAYHLYALDSSTLDALVDGRGFEDAVIAAEPDSVIIPWLEERGAKIQHMTNYVDTMEFLRGMRVDAVAGIDATFDDLIKTQPAVYNGIVKSEKPLLERSGYIMFSRSVYDEFSETIECFWTESARLKRSTWFAEMRASYEE